MEKNENKLAALEALLFIHGEPVEVGKIEKVLKFQKDEARELISNLRSKLEDQERGLTLVLDGDRVQMVTKPDFGEILASFIKEELTQDLTPASLEALSIITYLGPISRSRLEYFRGVNSFFTLRNLMLRGLIERFPDPKRPNSYLYKASLEIVRHLGLRQINELPEYAKFRELLKTFEANQTGSLN